MEADDPLPVHRDPHPVGDSYDVSVSFQVPVSSSESAIGPRPMPSVDAGAQEQVKYTIVNGGSKRGKPILTDTRGYRYNQKPADKRCSSSRTVWTCSVRRKGLCCLAKVYESEDGFVPGPQPHTHTAEPGQDQAAEIVAEVKKRAAEQVFVPANTIAEDVLLDMIKPDALPASLPCQANIVRYANRHRQRNRPCHPQTLDFEVQDAFIPDDFLLADVFIDGARHFIFATNDQHQLLQKAKFLYADGTFKLVKDPFYQLFSIHAFIQQDDSVRQVPLLFAIMSRRRRQDYVEVLSSVKDHISALCVQKITLDFEQALWAAVREVLPGVEIQGCVFHWTQAVFRKVVDLGFKVPYQTSGAIHEYIRQLLALPFLPAEHIPAMFGTLAGNATPPLQPLVDYIRTTWIENPTWPVTSWSIFGLVVRTNNDVEGWHNRINARGTNLNFYRLVELLHREARIVTLQTQLVGQNKLSRAHRTVYKQVQAKLEKLWQRYRERQITTGHLLRACSRLYGPIDV